MKDLIDNVLVVKVGTNTLIEKNKDGSEKLDLASFGRIGKQIIKLQESGMHVAIVTSAAITASIVATGLQSRPRKEASMTNLQRSASIGWRYVLNAWADALDGLNTGSLLLTQRELGLGQERDETLKVTHELMAHGDIAIVNENDAISHQEIAFGDNDTLAATYAAQIGRSSLFGSNVRLMLLSDIDGVYADINDSGSLIRTINKFSDYAHLAHGRVSTNGTGGMVTKFAAAQIVAEHGIDMWIANGREDNIIELALNNERGTHFVS